jgi:diacylglycerol kinase (ATP)
MNKRIKSFGYAIKGIRLAVQSEINMRIHVFVMILVVFCGIFFNISVNEWLLCLLCFALVISTEMLNTSIEKIVNMISPQRNQIAGEIKDIAAGAVFVNAIVSVIIGLFIFIPKLFIFIQSLF